MKRTSLGTSFLQSAVVLVLIVVLVILILAVVLIAVLVLILVIHVKSSQFVLAVIPLL